MNVPQRRGWLALLALPCCLMVAACSSSDSAPTDSGSGDSGKDGTGAGGVSASGGNTGTGGGAAIGGDAGSSGRAGGGVTGAAGTAGAIGATGGVPGSGGGPSHGGQGGRAPGTAGFGGKPSGQAGTSGGSAGTTVGHGGTAGSAGRPGAGGKGGTGGMGGGLGPQAPGGRVTGYGTVLFSTRSSVEIIRLQTTMVVPPEPPPSGTLFLWPGLQPNGANFKPIDNGVLQPVLTWGPSCAPGKQPRAYSSWWISGQYVNTFGSDPGYTGCQGGPIIAVEVGDTLNIDMALAGTIWTQTVTDLQTGQSVAYSIDMMNQAQNLAYFIIEEYSSAPISDVVFTDIVITFGSPDAADCKLTMRGQNDFVSVPVASSDGRSCAVQAIILRAQGVP